MNLFEAEKQLLSNRGNQEVARPIRAFLLRRKSELDYIMSRFIDQFGGKLDVERNDKYHKFVKVQSEEYAKLTRLERVMAAYQ